MWPRGYLAKTYWPARFFFGLFAPPPDMSMAPFGAGRVLRRWAPGSLYVFVAAVPPPAPIIPPPPPRIPRFGEILRGFNAAAPERSVNFSFTPEQLDALNINVVGWFPGLTWTHPQTGAQYGNNLWPGPIPGATDDVWTVNIDFDFADEFITNMNALGITVILDPHTFPGCYLKTTSTSLDWLWWRIAYHDIAATLWAAVADHYKGWGPGIWYEIFNEPQTPSRDKLIATGDAGVYPPILTSETLDFSNFTDYPGYAGFNDAAAWVVGARDPRSWQGLVDTLINAIRVTGGDTVHKVLVSSQGRGGGLSKLSPHFPAWKPYVGVFDWRINSYDFQYLPSDPNMIWVDHYYWPQFYQTRSQIAYQYTSSPGVIIPVATESEVNDSTPLIETLVNEQWQRDRLQSIRDFQLTRPGMQVAITECGPNPNLLDGSPKPGVVDFMLDYLRVFEEFGWHTLFHTVGTGLKAMNLREDQFNVCKNHWLKNIK